MEKYTKRKSTLLIQGARRVGKTIPFEVKSRDVSSITSLEEFKKIP